MRLKSYFALAILLLAAVAAAPDGPESPLPPPDPAAPLRAELPVEEILLGLWADRTAYSPREPVLVELGIRNTSNQEITLKTVGLVVSTEKGPLPTAGTVWLPGQVRILGRRGRHVWTSGAYNPPQRVLEQRTLPPDSRAGFQFLWPQFSPSTQSVRPGEYVVEAQFFVSREGWKGGFPILSLPITIVPDPLHPSCEVEKESLTWRLDLDRAVSHPGQGIRLKLTVANIGKEPVTIWWHQQFFDSYFSVADSEGKEVWSNRPKEEEKGFEALWPTAVTFPPGECKLVAQAQWDGRLEMAEEGTEEKKWVDAPAGEYTVKTARGFPSMPILEDLKFSLLAP